MYDHEQLDIWRRSHALTLAIHRAFRSRVRGVPAQLRSQLSRSSTGVAANIAESGGQETSAQSARYIDMALGSLSETQNHLRLAADTGLITPEQVELFAKEVGELKRMTFSFKKWLLRSPR
ncbi:MAG: four helix bundle protein [Gemmatimonadaceae bacterium]